MTKELSYKDAEKQNHGSCKGFTSIVSILKELERKNKILGICILKRYKTLLQVIKRYFHMSIHSNHEM